MIETTKKVVKYVAAGIAVLAITQVLGKLLEVLKRLAAKAIEVLL